MVVEEEIGEADDEAEAEGELPVASQEPLGEPLDEESTQVAADDVSGPTLPPENVEETAKG